MTSYSLAFETMDRDLSGLCVTRCTPVHHFRNHFYKIAFLLFGSFCFYITVFSNVELLCYYRVLNLFMLPHDLFYCSNGFWPSEGQTFL